MNRNIIRNIFKLKMEIIGSITDHLPPNAKEKFDNIQQDLLVGISEAVNEYIGKKKKDDDSGSIKKVSID